MVTTKRRKLILGAMCPYTLQSSMYLQSREFYMGMTTSAHVGQQLNSQLCRCTQVTIYFSSPASERVFLYCWYGFDFSRAARICRKKFDSYASNQELLGSTDQVQKMLQLITDENILFPSSRHFLIGHTIVLPVYKYFKACCFHFLTG